MKHALQKKIQAMLDEAVATGETAGYSLLIRKDDEELIYAAAGYADIEAKKPLRRDHIFRLYSQSKPITSAAVMILLERGLIDLMDPVSKYLPGFAHPQIITEEGLHPAACEINLWNLLSMTSGTSYPDPNYPACRAADELFKENAALMEQGRGMDTVTFCNRIGQLPLAFEPGTRFQYGTSADILGAVVEVVSGMRFGEFLQKELFEPLGMKDTAFYVPEDKRDRLVNTYDRADDGTLSVWNNAHLCVGIPSEAPAFESGGAGLFSTLDDYAAFGQMLLNGGRYHGHRILHERTVQFMTTPQLNHEQQQALVACWHGLAGFNYGKLMRVCIDPGQAMMLASPGEYGWDGWLGTYFANLPRENMTILWMTNRRMNDEQLKVLRRVRNLVLASIDPEE